MRKKQREYKIGDRFGRLVLVSYMGLVPTGKYLKSKWLCRCDCGDECEAWQESLNKGKTVSCPKRHTVAAALKGRKLLTPNRFFHGHTRKGWVSLTFSSWRSMIQRITNPNATGYAHYRKLGITICDRWLHGEAGKKPFQCFLEDMGERPSGKATLERIDNNGNYEPGNCEWASRKAQARNRRTTLFYTWQGKPHSLKELAAETGISFHKLRHRLVRLGWPVERAVGAG